MCLFLSGVLPSTSPCQHYYPLASVLILTATASLKLLLVLPSPSGLSLLSFLEQLLVILSWGFSSSFTLCYRSMYFIQSSFSISYWGSITRSCSSLRPLQCQAQFLDHNKDSVIICLTELKSNTFKQFSLHYLLTE